MLNIEAWGHSAENDVGEDEVLSECFKWHMKQFSSVFFSSACIILLVWCGGSGRVNRCCPSCSSCSCWVSIGLWPKWPGAPLSWRLKQAALCDGKIWWEIFCDKESLTGSSHLNSKLRCWEIFSKNAVRGNSEFFFHHSLPHLLACVASSYVTYCCLIGYLLWKVSGKQVLFLLFNTQFIS